MEHKVAKAEKMETEMEMAKCEVQTLKRLLQGKDHLVIQKSKALDVAKVGTDDRIRVSGPWLKFFLKIMFIGKYFSFQ